MKKIFTTAFFLFSLVALSAQSFQTISTGLGYRKQSFVSLSTNSEKIIDDNTWDIAFSVQGMQDAGVFLNESSGSSMGQALPRLQAFVALSDKWTDAIDPAILSDFEVLNDEKSWFYGAFNASRDASNPFDYGWGIYNPSTNTVVGTKIFVIKLRNGNFLKFQIQALSGTTYTFRYAQLDGSNEQVRTINKAAHPNKFLAYFSFNTGNTVDLEPAGGFDLWYKRYVTTIYDPGSQQNIRYNVTGILLGKQVSAAAALGVDPNTVRLDDYRDKLTAQPDVIGYDWKVFSNSTWKVDDKRVYFVRTADNTVWKIQFIDFEGSTTGKTVFQKTNLGKITAVGDPNSSVKAFSVFPNPVVDDKVHVVFHTHLPHSRNDAHISLTDMQGRLIFEQNMAVQPDLNAYILPTGNLPAGVYVLHLHIGNERLSHKIIKN